MGTENKVRKDTIWNRTFACILVVNFFQQMGQQLVTTLVPLYASVLGASAYLVGMLSTAFAVTALLTRPFTAPAFDSMSKKRLLALALVGFGMVFVGFIFTKSYPMLLAGRMIQGICLGCLAPLSLAIAGESLPSHLMGSGIGVFTLAQAVAQALGPNLALELSRRAGYPVTFAAGAVVMGLALFFALLMPEIRRDRAPYRISWDKLVEKDSLHPAVMMFFITAAYTCVNYYLAIFGRLLGVENIGLYFTVYALFLLMARPVSGRLIDKYGYAKVLVPGMLCFALSFVVIGLSRSLAGFLAAGVISAFGCGVCHPATQSLSMSCAPLNRRGAAANTSYLGADLGLLVGPSCAGLLADRVAAVSGSVRGYTVMFCALAAPVLLALTYFLLFRRKIQGTILRNSQKG